MTRASDGMVRRFDALCRQASDRTLVCTPQRTWTVGQLGELERRFGDLIDCRNRTESPVVGIHLPNGPAFLAALIAVRRAGRVALLTDSRSPRPEVERIATSLGAGALWSGTDPTGELLPQLLPLAACRPLPSTRRPVGVIKLTSGTTGEPRGVATTTDALLADDAALRASMGILDDDRLLAAIPFSHSYGLSSLVMPALVRGLPLLLAGDGVAFDPLESTRELEPTVFPTVPAYLGALVRRSNPAPLPRSLRLVISAAAALPQQVARRFFETYRRRVHVFYGASECGGISYDRRGDAGERGTLGTPVEGVRVELRRVGDAHRVVVSSAAVAECYLGSSDDRLQNGEYVTDDLAEWRDAELTLTGCIGNRINVRGNKVDPREVEAVLGRHVGVEDARVVAIPRAQSADAIVRAVVVKRDKDLSSRDLVDWCRAHLADFKVPRHVFFVDHLPVNARGKVDAAELARLGSPGSLTDGAEPDR